MRGVLFCVASTSLAWAQAKPAPAVPDRLPDTYQIYSLLMPGQVFTDMDSGHNQPWAISDTTINEDDMNPKLAPEATLQPPEDNPRAFREAVMDYNQRKKERLVLKRRFKLDRPYVLLADRRYRAVPCRAHLNDRHLELCSLRMATTWASPTSARSISMLRKPRRWSTSSIGAVTFVRRRSGSILKNKMALGYADPAKRPHRLKNFGGEMRFAVRVLVYFLSTVAGLVGGNAFAQDQSNAQPLRVAIVGLEHGHVGGFLKQFPKQNEVQLVGIVDADTELSHRYAQQFHLDPSLFYTQLDTMIAARHPQALLVYTSIGKHRQVIEAAAQHGLSVMVEKPLTMSLEDALAIRHAAREHHIQVLVNYETTWYASNRAAYDEVAKGSLGDLRRVVVHDGHEGPKEIGVQPEFLKWLEDPEQNGDGALYDFGCYGADLVTWLMHGESPLSVTAVTQTDKPEIYPKVADESTIILRYPKAQAVLMGSWNWPFGRKDMEVYGATGYLITVGPDQVRVRTKGQAQESESTAPPLTPPNDGSLHYLAAVLKGSLQPNGDLTSLETNVVVMQILDAARQSAHEGRTIKLAPLPK